MTNAQAANLVTQIASHVRLLALQIATPTTTTTASPTTTIIVEIRGLLPTPIVAHRAPREQTKNAQLARHATLIAQAAPLSWLGLFLQLSAQFQQQVRNPAIRHIHQLPFPLEIVRPSEIPSTSATINRGPFTGIPIATQYGQAPLMWHPSDTLTWLIVLRASVCRV